MSNSDTPFQAQGALPPDLDALSHKLVEARLQAQALSQYPGELPATLADAYRVQSASIARWPDAVQGWKVGMVPAPFRERLDADRLCGPIFSQSVFMAASGAALSMPIYVGGFAAVEAEFVFRLAHSVAPGQVADNDNAAAEAVSGLHVGVEIASSPMAAVNRLGPVCVVTDFGNNAGLIVGPSIANWRAARADDLKVSVAVDGQTVGSASAAAIEGGLLRALRFLLNVAGQRGITLPEGTYVSCGAVTGIHEVTTTSASVVDFGEHGVFDVAFEALAPRPPAQTLAQR